jgi:hypothetical protein
LAPRAISQSANGTIAPWTLVVWHDFYSPTGWSKLSGGSSDSSGYYL